MILVALVAVVPLLTVDAKPALAGGWYGYGGCGCYASPAHGYSYRPAYFTVPTTSHGLFRTESSIVHCCVAGVHGAGGHDPDGDGVEWAGDPAPALSTAETRWPRRLAFPGTISELTTQF